MTREVKLSVHHAPSVEDMVSTLHSGLGREERIECVVHSSPRAQVWLSILLEEFDETPVVKEMGRICVNFQNKSLNPSRNSGWIS